jgi:hypothetical protein
VLRARVKDGLLRIAVGANSSPVRLRCALDADGRPLIRLNRSPDAPHPVRFVTTVIARSRRMIGSSPDKLSVQSRRR